MSAKGKGQLLMKNALLLLYFCGSILFVTGCWDRTEVNDLAIVTAAAIDKKENNQIELSLQLFIPKSLSMGGGQGGGGGGGGQMTLAVSHKGDNIADALSKLQAQLPREVFWGQCKVFIFGEKAAREGIQEHMDFLLRHPEPRERAFIYVSEGDAKRFLELSSQLERYSGESIREQSKRQLGIQVTMQDLDEMLTGNAHVAALPYLKIRKDRQTLAKSYNYPELFATAVFMKDKMIGTLNESDTRGVLWLRKEIKGYTVNVKPKSQKREVSLNPVSARVKLIPRIKGDEWKMFVKINTEGAIVQNGTNLNFSDPKAIKLLEKAYQIGIKERIEDALKKTQHELKTDIVGFSDEFHRKYPKQWKQIENQWETKFPDVKVIIDVQAHVRRQGYINKPGGMPQEEVKK